MKPRDAVKYGLPLVLIPGVFILLFFAQKWAQEPREFRGTFRCVEMRIGGEGGPATLETSDGAYDLFFGRDRVLNADLAALDGRRVIVLGHLRTVRGVERKRYRAIEVVQVSPE